MKSNVIIDIIKAGRVRARLGYTLILTYIYQKTGIIREKQFSLEHYMI
jgi:hypothetical protein